MCAPFYDGYMGVVVWWVVVWVDDRRKTEGERGECGVPLLNGVRSGAVVVAPGVGVGRPEGAGGGDHPPKILIGGTHTYKIFVEFLCCVCVTIGLFVTLGVLWSN